MKNLVQTGYQTIEPNQIGTQTRMEEKQTRPRKNHGQEPPHAPPPSTPAYDPPPAKTATACTTRAESAAGAGEPAPRPRPGGPRPAPGAPQPRPRPGGPQKTHADTQPSSRLGRKLRLPRKIRLEAPEDRTPHLRGARPHDGARAVDVHTRPVSRKRRESACGTPDVETTRGATAYIVCGRGRPHLLRVPVLKRVGPRVRRRPARVD